MALSFGIFSTFLAAETAPLMKPSSSSLRLSAPPALQLPSISNVRTARRMTCTAVSKPAAAAAAESKPREPRGIMKPRQVSPEMKDFLGGVAEIPRTQALKEIWAYIKSHDLQDPANKKVIICDEELKKIFAGKEQVHFLEIAGLISPHFLK